MSKILIVDDESVIALSYEKVLKSYGYDVVGIASNGDDALQKVSDLSPDLVLMDIVLNGEMDGVEVATKIYDNHNIPVIYITAHPNKDEINRVKITEPYGYMVKPVDVTELKSNIEMAIYKHKIEGKLRESEENFRAVAENAYDGILITNNQGQHLFSNQRAAEITGYPNEELLNMSIYDLTHKNKHNNLKINLKNRVFGNENSPYETHIINKENSDVPVEITGSRTIWQGQNAEILIIRDISNRKKTKKHMQELLKQEKVLTDELKVVNAYLTQTKDQLEKTIEKLKFSNRELEQFAYIASHDLQEPLRMVSSFTQLLEMKYGNKLDENAKEYIKFAVDGAKQMEVLINDLLAYSRVTTYDDRFKEVNLEKILDEVIFNMEFDIRDNHVAINHDPLPSIYGDYSQMKQVFQNLIGNAIKYKGSKMPKINISAQEKDNEWLFSVKDNGIGIDPEYSRLIFKIFKRLHTREEYEGTGIGLAITDRIVSHHGGKIWVESKLGEGSSFYFTIPKVKNDI